MRKINLLFVITKLELGGAQKQLLLLLRHLDIDRYNLFLIAANKGLLIDEASSIKGLKLKTLWALDRPINPIKDLMALCEIYRFIKRNNIDIVHTHSSKAGLLARWAAKLAGVDRVIHTVHGWSFNDYQARLLRSIFVGLERITAKITYRLIVVSNTDKHRGISKRIGRVAQYALITYGIDHKEFQQTSKNIEKIKKALGINGADFLVGMVACFKPQKAPLDYIKVADLVHRLYPRTKFVLIGDGLLREQIERSIDNFSLRNDIILTGWRRDIPKILSAIDVFVLTSLWEGLPIAVLEAMASSKSVVVTDTGGISEIIKPGFNGFLVAPRDLEGLKDRIIALLQDKGLRYQMGRRARDASDFGFKIPDMIRQTQNLYEDLINTKGSVSVN